MYLKFIFEHSSSLCEEVFEMAGASYVAAYDALVHREGHGTPGSSLKKRAAAPAEMTDDDATLTRTAVSESRISEAQRLDLARAETLVASWHQQQEQHIIPDREFWNDYWDGSYYGFRYAQMEMGKFRDDISRGEFEEGQSRHTLDYLKKELNQMLLASVREWYMKWGELDLHRLSFKDAVEIIQRMLKQPPWKQMRVVAGQRSHVGDDHHSEGVLYSLIHRIFDPSDAENLALESLSDQDILVRDCQRYVHDNDIEVTFYSNGAAVLLKRQRRNRSTSVRISRSEKSGMLRTSGL